MACPNTRAVEHEMACIEEPVGRCCVCTPKLRAKLKSRSIVARAKRGLQGTVRVQATGMACHSQPILTLSPARRGTCASTRSCMRGCMPPPGGASAAGGAGAPATWAAEPAPSARSARSFTLRGARARARLAGDQFEGWHMALIETNGGGHAAHETSARAAVAPPWAGHCTAVPGHSVCPPARPAQQPAVPAGSAPCQPQEQQVSHPQRAEDAHVADPGIGLGDVCREGVWGGVPAWQAAQEAAAVGLVQCTGCARDAHAGGWPKASTTGCRPKLLCPWHTHTLPAKPTQHAPCNAPSATLA